MSNRFRYYPLKPESEEDFKKAVAWFGGRELIASLKGLIIYTIYGENNDPRAWMKPNIYPELEEKLNNQLSLESDDENVEVLRTEVIQRINMYWANKNFHQWEWKKNHFSFWEDYLEKSKFWEDLNRDEKSLDEFWFDYISDTGDGQMGVYSVACLCLSDLWLDGEKIGSPVSFNPPEKSEYKNKTLLPRGSFLFIGGDTAYHSADYQTLFERFQSPFRWAFISVRKFMWENYGIKIPANKKFQFANQKQNIEDILDAEGNFHTDWDGTFAATLNENIDLWDTEPLRPIFGIPANHDYYDAIAGFNKQFRRPPFKDIQENSTDNKFWGNIPLKIHSFSRQQEASYVALHLPFNWWMFGVDSENQEFDNRQKVFFSEIVNKWKPNKLILATPEPTTVFGIQCTETDKTATYLTEITKPLWYQQPFLNGGKFLKLDSANAGDILGNQCRLDLSGDIHHYARYWGPIEKDTIAEDFDEQEYSIKNYASLVAGGGGAFFDSTDTLIGKKEIKTRDGNSIKVEGDIPPRAIYPGKKESVVRTADKIFDLWNIKKGGYVQIAGSVAAIIIFFCLTQVSNVKDSFIWLNETLKTKGFVPFWSSFSNPLGFIMSIENRGFTIWLIVFAMTLLFAASGLSIRQLRKKLETTDQTIDEIEAKDGRLYQLLIRFVPVLFGLILYVGFILPWQSQLADEIDAYVNSWFLLYHFAFAGLLGWIAFEYGKWLAIRVRLTRVFKNRTCLQKIRDPLNVGKNSFQRFIGRMSREYTLEYIPDSILLVLACFFIILGIGIFGQGSLMRTGADILFILVFFGGFFLIAVFLGVVTGGSYQKPKGKFIFGLLGTFHALLQLLTPFFLVFFGNWVFTLIFFGMAIIFNGLSRSKYGLGNVLEDQHKQNGFRSKIWRLANFQLGGWIMKKNKPILLTLTWIAFGLFTLLTPLILTYFVKTEYQTIDSLVKAYFLTEIVPDVINRFNTLAESFPDAFAEWLLVTFIPLTAKWLPVLAVMTIVGFIGYRTSRVWFSWYLGVSLAFNGHNNEVGGLARIEGFKHILRIRVRENKLTVFVIGIQNAKPDLNDLNLNDESSPKLVDKFDLICQ